MMVRAFLLGIFAATFLVSPALASNTTIALENAHRAELEEVFASIRAGDPNAAIATADRVVAAYETAFRGKIVKCADGLDDAVKVTILTADKNTDITVVGPGWCQALFAKGFALIDLHRSDEAEPFLARAVTMAPTDAHYLNEYAELWKGRREWQRSFDLFSQSFDLVDHDPKGRNAPVAARALRGMGFTKIELGDLDEAERLFRRSLEFDPKSTGARSELEYIARKKAVGTPRN